MTSFFSRRAMWPSLAWLAILALAAVAAPLPCPAAEEVAKAPQPRPNVLFIAIDDLNDWVGCLKGHPQVKTPHLDRLAARGMLFTNAHCQSPLCNPSRTSVLTGLRPSTTGIYGLAPWFRTQPHLKTHVTLPQHFAAHGYRTLTAGKIYHGGYGRPGKGPAGKNPMEAEFHTWGPGSVLKERRAQPFVQVPNSVALMDWGPHPEKDEDTGDYDVATWACQQLATPQPGPFFLAVGFAHPHVPCYAPQKWFDLYPSESLTLPPVNLDDRSDTPEFSWYLHWKLPEPRLSWLKESGEWAPLVRAYLASVSFVDGQVGRVLDALEQSGQAENTIVVVWSDHGWHLGEKGITGKNTLWERSTHVPLIFAGPGVAQGAACGRPVELLDLYPTLSELCGLPAQADLDGHSIAALTKDPQAKRAWPAITTHNPGNHTVRTERWRYIRYADGSEELYDMAADPNEWTNLAGQEPYAAIQRELADTLPATSAPLAPGSAHRTLEQKDGVWLWEGKPVVAREKVQ